MLRPFLALLNKDTWETDGAAADSPFVLLPDLVRRQLVRLIRQYHHTTMRRRKKETDEAYVARYLREHASLNRQFRKVAKDLGLEEMYRKLAAGAKDPDLEWLVKAWELFEYALLYKSSTTEDTRHAASAEALGLFIQFLRSSISRDLRVCKRPGCEQYFFNVTGQQEFCPLHKKYRANRTTIEKRRKEREQEAKNKLRRVQKVLNRMKRQPGWIYRAAKHARVTPNYITRNLNERLLKT
jgi:hypothetical protein